MPPESLRLEGISADLDRRPVLEQVSFEVPAGSTTVVLGPNGSGKTTLLRCIAGFERPRAGHVFLGTQEMTMLPTHRRRVGLVAQEPSLFLHRTVAENIAYGPELRHRPRAEVDEQVRSLGRQLGIEGLLGRPASRLSGGEQQRAALARALAAEPRALLLDEPFASIDAPFRAGLRAEFRSALRDREIPVLHVTHDREEGLFLADQLVLLFDGRVHARGDPRRLFGHPPSARAAAFLGYNLLPVDRGIVAVLPRALRLVGPSEGRLAGELIASGWVGEGEELQVRLTDRSVVTVRLAPGERALPVRRSVGLDWQEEVSIPEDPARRLPG
ncbi:MAG: ATP-binding cassette domain-containing protein [Thermoplasmata archaeon]|nr:ATP-binding cassette domain-containing protein [Thermoplasmata archaeon]